MNSETQGVIDFLRTLAMELELQEAEVLEVIHEFGFMQVSYDGSTLDYKDTRVRKDTIVWKVKT